MREARRTRDTRVSLARGRLLRSLSYLLPKLGTNRGLHETEIPENPKVTFGEEERFNQAWERFFYIFPSAFMSIKI